MSEDQATETEQAPRGGSVKGTVIGFVLATLLAAAAGGGMGFVLGPKFATALSGKETASPKKKEEKKEEIAEPYAHDSTLVRLQPVTTNLRVPFRSWVRLEGALIVRGAKMDEKALEELGAEVQQDVLAYLRTLGLKDLEGASNLAFLRDDLNERARERSEGRVAEFVILSLVVE